MRGFEWDRPDDARRERPGPDPSRPDGHRLVPLATALLEGNGRILHWSEDAEALLGYTAEEAVGSYAARLLVSEAELPNVTELFGRILNGHGWSGVFPLRHRDGRVVELEFRTYPIRGPGGVPLLLATASDVSALREVEGGLAILNGFFSQSPIGLAVYDPDLRFVRINEALARINGLPVDAHLGRRISNLLPGLNSAEIEQAMRRVLVTGRPVIDARSHGRTPATRAGTARGRRPTSAWRTPPARCSASARPSST